MEIYSDGGSGWIIDKIEGIWINIANYEPLARSSYFPLPSELKKSIKLLINRKSKDDKCFKWGHVRFINPQNKDADKIKNKIKT